MRSWKMAAFLPILGGAFAPPLPAPDRGELPVLYFFFSPETPGGAQAARRAGDWLKTGGMRLRFRPVVLIDRFKGLGKLEESSPFYRTIKELQSLGPLDLPVYEPEGVALAALWELRSLPAFVLVRQGRAHVALGSAARLETLWEGDP